LWKAILRARPVIASNGPTFAASRKITEMSLGKDQDVRKPVPHASLPLPKSHRIQDVEQDAHETALKVPPIPNRLIGDRVELMIRRRSLDLDCNGPVDYDVGPRSAARLFHRDEFT